MNPRFRKLLRIGLILFFLLVAVGLTGLVLVSLNQEKIRTILITELNKHLEARVEVGDVSFSLLKHFPRSSLSFREVNIFTDLADEQAFSSDTLLKAQEVNLVFNLLKLLKKDYVVSQLVIRNGYLTLLTDASGKNYFTIWKRTEKGNQGVEFELSNLILMNVTIDYRNEPSEIHFLGTTSKTSIKGKFSDRRFRLKVVSDPEFHFFRIRQVETDKTLPVLCRMELEKNDSTWIFSDVNLTVSGLDFILSGEINTGENKQLNLAYEGKKLNTRTLLELLPPQWSDRFHVQRSNGILELKGYIRGPFGKTLVPESSFSFDFRDAGLTIKNSPFEISDLECRGSFTNGDKRSPESSIFRIESFGAGIGSGNLSGHMEIRNLLRPVVSGGFTGSWKMEELTYLLPSLDKFQPAGNLRSNIRFLMHPESIGRIKTEDIASAELSGNLSLDDLSFYTGNNRYHISGMKGDLMFSEAVWFDELVFNLNGMETRLNGKAEHVLSYLFRGEKILFIEAEAYIPLMEVDRIILSAPAEDEENTSGKRTARLVKTDISFRIDEFRWKKFQASYAEGIIMTEPGLVMIPAIGFSTMQGNVRGNGMVMEQPGNGRMLHTNMNLSRLHVRDLFNGFSDFGQKFITARHLNGTLSGELTARANFSHDWKLEKSSLLVESNLKLENGELIDFEPMKKLSRFVEIEELEHVRFNYLENNIYIRDQKVIVPQMDIFSNAFNISVTGEHGFNNYFQYRLRVLLSELLSKNARPRLGKETEFGVVQEDGLNQTSIYLMIEGTPDNYNVSYDRKAVREVLKKGFQQQGQEIRQIMNEEFGWFRSDSIPQELPTQGPFRVMWEEDTVPETPLPQQTTKKKPPFRVTWEESSDTLKKK